MSVGREDFAEDRTANEELSGCRESGVGKWRGGAVSGVRGRGPGEATAKAEKTDGWLCVVRRSWGVVRGTSAAGRRSVRLVG